MWYNTATGSTFFVSNTFRLLQCRHPTWTSEFGSASGSDWIQVTEPSGIHEVQARSHGLARTLSLSLSGGPLLLMELAFLLRSAGSDVVWITNQKPPKPDDVIYTLENKMLDRGVQVLLKQSTKLNTLFFLTLFSN